jgi:hypothetical protein
MSTTLPPRGLPPIGADEQFVLPWWGWFTKINIGFSKGFTGTKVTAKLTPTGTNGTDTYVNGFLVSVVPPT